jgi:hypothetical protein
MTDQVCITCKYADWYKTKNDRLHPGGDGRCRWAMPAVNLPIAFYYIGQGDMHAIPTPSGGYINRKRSKPCPAWEAKS